MVHLHSNGTTTPAAEATADSEATGEQNNLVV